MSICVDFAPRKWSFDHVRSIVVLTWEPAGGRLFAQGIMNMGNIQTIITVKCLIMQNVIIVPVDFLLHTILICWIKNYRQDVTTHQYVLCDYRFKRCSLRNTYCSHCLLIQLLCILNGNRHVKIGMPKLTK